MNIRCPTPPPCPIPPTPPQNDALSPQCPQWSAKSCIEVNGPKPANPPGVKHVKREQDLITPEQALNAEQALHAAGESFRHNLARLSFNGTVVTGGLGLISIDLAKAKMMVRCKPVDLTVSSEAEDSPDSTPPARPLRSMQTGQNSIAPETSLPQLGQVRWGSVLMD
jgi:hypothetical protein